MIRNSNREKKKKPTIESLLLGFWPTIKSWFRSCLDLTHNDDSIVCQNSDNNEIMIPLCVAIFFKKMESHLYLRLVWQERGEDIWKGEELSVVKEKEWTDGNVIERVGGIEKT